MAVIALNLGSDVSETTNGDASPAALELFAIRSGGMAGVHGGSEPPAGISFRPPGSGERVSRPVPRFRRRKAAPALGRSRLRTGCRSTYVSRADPPQGFDRAERLSREHRRHPGPHPSPKRSDAPAPGHICAPGLLPAGVEAPCEARRPRTRRDVDVRTLGQVLWARKGFSTIWCMAAREPVDFGREGSFSDGAGPRESADRVAFAVSSPEGRGGFPVYGPSLLRGREALPR